MRVRIGLRGRLFLVSVGLLVIGIAAAGLVLSNYLDAWLVQREWARLEHTASTLATALRDVRPEGRARALERFSHVAGLHGVALHDGGSGPVLTGGAADFEAAPGLAGPTERALDGRRGRLLLPRAGGAGDLLVTFVPLTLDGAPAVLRAATDGSALTEARRRVTAFLVIAGLVGLAVAGGMSALSSHAFASWLRRLLDRIRVVIVRAGGSVPGATEDLGGLVGSVDRVGRQLEATVDALAVERWRFQRVVETLDEGILALDGQGRVTLANPAARALLALPDDATGRPLVEVARTPGLVEQVRRAARGETSEGELDIGQRPRRRLVVHAAPLDRFGAALVALRDVTEVRRLEAMRRDLVANVSHEIRTPIAVIRANAETLLDGALEDPAAARRFTEAIHRHSDRLGRLVSDLLDLARIEAGRRELAPRPLALRDAVERVLAGVELLAEGRGQRLTADVPPDARVLADPDALGQILLNLVENAVRYGAEGGHVTVRAVPTGAAVRVEVEDDGPGIAAHHRERIFERFYRVDPARSRDTGGTGLGLSIVKHLVLGLGGQVGVEPGAGSAPGRPGCRFWLTLPAAPPAPAAPAATAG